MTPDEQKTLLIRMDERLKTVAEILEGRQTCHDKVLTHEERLKTHGKLIWGALGGVGTLAIGLIMLGIQVLFSGGKP